MMEKKGYDVTCIGFSMHIDMSCTRFDCYFVHII